MRIGKRKNRPAVAATELALLLPFLGFLFVVAADYCRVFHLTQTLDDCAQNAVMYASGAADPNPANFASVTDAAQQAALDEGSRLSPALAINNVQVNLTSSTATVTITYTFKTLTRLPGLPASITVTRSVMAPIAPRPPGYTFTSK